MSKYADLCERIHQRRNVNMAMWEGRKEYTGNPHISEELRYLGEIKPLEDAIIDLINRLEIAEKALSRILNEGIGADEYDEKNWNLMLRISDEALEEIRK